MLASISISGLGSHADTALIIPSPKGRTVVRGPSESGKSSLGEALCFALWGRTTRGGAFDPALIPDEAKEASVKLVLTSGTEIERHRGRKGSQRRIVRKGGEEFEYATEEQMSAALGPFAQRDLCRQVMIPLAWVPLAQDSTGGRPFRDLLASVVPGGTAAIVREAMGEAWSDDMPTTEKAAVEARREANSQRDQAIGRRDAHRQAARQAAANVEAIVLPDSMEVGSAVALGATVLVWEQFGRDLALWQARSQASDDYAQRVAAWEAEEADLAAMKATLLPRDAHKAALKEVGQAKIAAGQAHVRAATVARSDAARRKDAAGLVVRDAQTRLSVERVSLRSAEDKLAVAQRSAALLSEVPCGGMDGCRFLADARLASESVAVLEAEVAQLIGSLPTLERAITDAAERAAASFDPAPDLQAEVEKAKAAEAEAIERDRDLEEKDRALGAAWSEVEARVKAHGPKPEPPANPGPRPEPPRSDRPTDSEIREARAMVERTQRLSAERGQAVRAKEQADATLAASEDAASKAEARAQALDRLVEAVRSAPTTLARRSVQALGDMGPVSIRFEGDGAKLYIDGREAREPLVSRGRIAFADAVFRQALRRALKLGWLLMLIDNAQDYQPSAAQAEKGETWESIKGPCILLYTAPTKDGRLEVTDATA
jgi:hypothetical protein